MIFLPGVLSQCGKKTIWGKYSIAFTEKEGTAATASRTYNKTTYAANAYTIDSGSFKLSSPSATQFQNLTKGKYSLNINNSNTTTSSGSTLYKITSNSGRTWTQDEGSYGSQITMRDRSGNGVVTNHVTGITFDSATGKFSSSGTSNGALLKGAVVYTNDMSGDSLECSGFTGASQVRKILIKDNWTATGDDQYLEYPVQTATISASGSSNVTVGYTPYTAVQIRGDFIETVESIDAAAYPENGAQGGYWYAKYSETPTTWERYSIAATEIKGASFTHTATSTTYLYRATAYSISGKNFTATGTRTRVSSLAVGNYLIQKDGTFVSSTSMSGDTLCKITKKSGSSSVSLTFDTYTVGDEKGSYVDTVTSYNPNEYPNNGIYNGYWYVRN